MEITFYHSRNCFIRGNIKKPLRNSKFIGFKEGYYGPSFIVDKKDFDLFTESFKKNIIKIKKPKI